MPHRKGGSEWQQNLHEPLPRMSRHGGARNSHDEAGWRPPACSWGGEGVAASDECEVPPLGVGARRRGGLDEVVDAEALTVCPQNPTSLLATVREVDVHGNLMFDAQIAARCREHGIDSILTNDNDFGWFEELHVFRLG